MSPKKKTDSGSRRAERNALVLRSVTANAKTDAEKAAASTLITGDHLMDNWRWVDLVDIKTGQPALMLEWLLGCRGFLTGRLVKLVADEGVGKTSFLMYIYAMAQRTADALCHHLESEFAMAPPDYLASFGVNVQDLFLQQPGTIENCMASLENFARAVRTEVDKEKQFPIVTGIDSISGFGADAEDTDETMDLTNTSGIGVHARALSNWLRNRSRLLNELDILMIAIAQYRAKIQTGPAFMRKGGGGPQKTTIADTPINYHSSWIFELNTSKLTDADGKWCGDEVRITSKKNKLAPKHRTVSLNLHPNLGFDLNVPTVEWLKRMSPWPLAGTTDTFSIVQHGPHLKCPMLASDKSFQSNPGGKAELLSQLYANAPLLASLREAMRIRGFGFEFEKNYQPSKEELEDINATPPPDEPAAEA